MPQPANRKNREQDGSAALDPIALTLAIWLGIVVCITAFGRLAQDGAAQAGQQSEPAPGAMAHPVPFR